MMRVLIIAALIFYTPPKTNGAELKLVGDAIEHKLTHVQSDKAGTFVVIGPDLLTFKASATVSGVALGNTTLNLRESLVMEEGKSCRFTGPPGAYVILQVVQGEPEPSHLVVTIMPSGNIPPTTVFSPPPPPVPQPLRTELRAERERDIQPDQLPRGTFGLAKFCFEKGSNVPLANRHLAGDVSNNFFQASKKDYVSIAAAETDISTTNRKTLGSSYTAWKPFFEAMEKRLVEIQTSTGATWGMSDFQTAFGEIAVGLQAVK